MKVTQSKMISDGAYYAGWNILVQLSHGSIRTMFQLLDYIFISSDFDSLTQDSIPPEVQDKYVREFSRRTFKKLQMISGGFRGEPIGKIISNITLFLTVTKTIE